MQIDIHTHDKQLAYDLLGRTSIQSGDQLSLADGVTLEFQRTTKRYSIDLPDVVTFALTVIGSVPAAVAADLLTDWIREKLSSRAERIDIDREEIEFDDEERVRRIVREKITHRRE